MSNKVLELMNPFNCNGGWSLMTFQVKMINVYSYQSICKCHMNKLFIKIKGQPSYLEMACFMSIIK